MKEGNQERWKSHYEVVGRWDRLEIGGQLADGGGKTRRKKPISQYEVVDEGKRLHHVGRLTEGRKRKTKK